MLRAYGITDKGHVRVRNEDCFVCDAAMQFCAVADGMGGHNAGDIAARIAVDTMIEYIREGHCEGDRWPFGRDPALTDAGNRMRTAIQLANQRVLETSVESAAYLGMGTTVVAALVESDRLIVGHAGDSRLYLLRKGRLRPLTEDDSYATVLARDPSVDPATARLHPMRHALTNVVGLRARTDVHLRDEPLLADDVLLLTTDGVHGTLDDGRMEQLLGQGGDGRELARGIVAAALAGGSRDNCTALIARYLPE